MSLLPTIVNWYGGKTKLAHQIILVMPPHEHYVEVFMGSAAVFFNKQKSSRNTLNDWNENLVNLFIQVRDHFDELAEKVYWTLYSRQEYKRFYLNYQSGFKGCNDIDRALQYLFLVRTSFNSRTGLGFSASIESNSANFNLVLIERLKLAREKLDSVVVENLDCNEIVKKYDSEGCFLFLDPPYWVADDTTYYEFVFNKKNHESLAFWLWKSKVPWLMTYDDVPEICAMYKDFHQQRLSVTYSIGARSDDKRKSKVRKINELLISNYPMKKVQLDVFDESDVVVEDVTEEEKLEVHLKLKKERELEESLKPKENVIKRTSQPTEQSNLFGS